MYKKASSMTIGCGMLTRSLDHSHHVHMLLTQAPLGRGINGVGEHRVVAVASAWALGRAGNWIGEDTSERGTGLVFCVRISRLIRVISLANYIGEFAS